MSNLKLRHKATLSVLSLVVGIFLVGFIYVYLNDRSTNTPTPVKTTVNQYNQIKPTKPAPNATVGVAVEALDSPVAPGATTSIIIQTTATAKCYITLTYKTGKSTDPALAPKTADDFGVVTWSWLVPADTSVGNWPIHVACYYGKSFAVLDQTLTVTR